MLKKLEGKFGMIFVAMFICITVVAGLVGCSGSATTKSNNTEVKTTSIKAKTKTITDMVGRKVTIPTTIKKVYSMSPIGTSFMYTLAPEKIAGLNYKLSDGEKKYTNDTYKNLPVLGGQFGQGQVMNDEEILKAKPDLILNMGDKSSSTASDCDKVQKQLGIPVIYVTGDLDKLDKAYEFMGAITGDTKQAKILGDYCKKTYNQIKGIAKKIPEDKKVSVYYAEGNKGTQTDPEGSSHTQLLDLVGAKNAANVQLQQGYGRSEVSMEQLLKWNPQTILVCFDQGFMDPSQNPYKIITNDSNWSNIKAVQDKKVYVIPYLPYNWFDRPPSVIRILGAKWLGNLLYPSYYKYNMKSEVKDFYSKFFHMKITDKQYEEITANSLR